MSPTVWPACPNCSSEAIEILHESAPDAPTSHATLKCTECGHVFKDVLTTPKSVEVDAVISHGAKSEPGKLSFQAGDRVRIDDEVLQHDHRLLITGIEVEDDRRVRSALVEEIETVWCKVFDTVEVPIAVNDGYRTWAGERTVPPEEEFFVGDRLTVRGVDVEIHAIKTGTGMRHRGSSKARDIRRLYARRARDPEGEDQGSSEATRGGER